MPQADEPILLCHCRRSGSFSVRRISKPQLRNLRPLREDSTRPPTKKRRMRRERPTQARPSELAKTMPRCEKGPLDVGGVRLVA